MTNHRGEPTSIDCPLFGPLGAMVERRLTTVQRVDPAVDEAMRVPRSVPSPQPLTCPVKPRLLPRSKSLPSAEFIARLTSGVKRHDSVQSSESATSASGGGGGVDSGLGSSDIDPGSPDGKGGPEAGAKKRTVDALTCGQAVAGASATIRVHYYPEGGWGWVVCACAFLVRLVTHGLHAAFGLFFLEVTNNFGQDKHVQTGCLGALSMGVSLFAWPIVVAFCRRKSVRLTAVLGGLVIALGCLFSSFATQFHQLVISFGLVLGLGVGMCAVTADLMVGQYFKRKREAVEVIVQSASGIGVLVISALYKLTISTMGWRFGLQTLTGVVSSAFFLGTFYRSASLYHPQRRAILHLKYQKRKVKDKNKEEKPAFFDFSTLRSRTVQILLLSAALSAFGINAPIVYLVAEAVKSGVDVTSGQYLQSFLGLAIVLGTSAFGLIVVNNSKECRIARHYLCQASGFMMAVSCLALTAIRDYHGFVFFAWIYGVFWGGYAYSLKMFTYEKVRARNFARTWGFVQWVQALPTAIGIPLTGYINATCGGRQGFYLSAGSAILGAAALLLVDVHRRRVAQRQRSPSSGGRRQGAPRGRRSSLPDIGQEEEEDDEEMLDGAAISLAVVGQRRFSDALCRRPELTCISEEGLADAPDIALDELYDCMTSCDQVEHYLVLSEYENNLSTTAELLSSGARGRKKSVVKPPAVAEEGPAAVSPPRRGRRTSVVQQQQQGRTTARKPSRTMSVIDEITTSL